MAATLALIAVMLPSSAPPYLARNMAILHGVLVALFTASGLPFGHAGLAGVKEDRSRLQSTAGSTCSRLGLGYLNSPVAGQ